MAWLPWHRPISKTAHDMEEEIEEEVLRIQAAEGAREEEFRRQYRRNHPGLLRRLFGRRTN
jgi:hypothetical protein